jgi:hypothetical protein
MVQHQAADGTTQGFGQDPAFNFEQEKNVLGHTGEASVCPNSNGDWFQSNRASNRST